MKDYRLILGVCVLLLIACLSGCQEKSNNDGNQTQNNDDGSQQHNNDDGDQQQNTDNEFIGDWEIVSSSPDYETWSFYTNESAKNIQTTEEDDGQPLTTIAWFEYTNDTTSVCFSPQNLSADSPNYFSECFLYSFSQNSTRLTLSSNGIVIMDLMKMPAK